MITNAPRTCTLLGMRASPTSPKVFPGRVCLAALALACGGCKGAVSFKLEGPAATVDAGATSTATSSQPPRPVVRIVRAGDRLTYENGEIEFETGSADLKGETTTEVLDQLAFIAAACLKPDPLNVMLTPSEVGFVAREDQRTGHYQLLQPHGGGGGEHGPRDDWSQDSRVPHQLTSPRVEPFGSLMPA